MGNGPHFLVIDGYAKAGRDELASGGATPAGELYVRMLATCAPGCTTDLMFPADPGVSMPAGAALASYDGIAWTGSSLTIYADDPMVTPQIELAKAAYAAKVPSFGSCWGIQLAVVAAGGRVAPCGRGREMGIARKIRLTPEGRAHPMYVGKPSVFCGFISHEDEVTHLPASALHLATNHHTNVQAVSVTHQGGTFWGLQYHPEYDLHELARLTACRADKLVRRGFFRSRDEVGTYVDKLETLHADPSRTEIGWLLGIDADVMSPDIRQAEVRNWIERLVNPAMAR